MRVANRIIQNGKRVRLNASEIANKVNGSWETIDNKLMNDLGRDALKQTDSITSYPVGFSIFHNRDYAYWPQDYGAILTFRTTDAGSRYSPQIYISTGNRIYIRIWNSSAWTSWKELS